jgi:hypothetical protein
VREVRWPQPSLTGGQAMFIYAVVFLGLVGLAYIRAQRRRRR